MVDVLKRSNALRWLLVVTLLLLLALRTLDGASGAPARIVSASMAESVAQPGQALSIKYIVDRKQSCPNTIESYWVHAADMDAPIVRMPPRSRQLAAIGENLSVYATAIAPRMFGELCYISRIHYQCGSGSHTVVTPPLCLVVVP